MRFRGSSHWSQGDSIQGYVWESLQHHFKCGFDYYIFHRILTQQLAWIKKGSKDLQKDFCLTRTNSRMQWKQPLFCSDCLYSYVMFRNDRWWVMNDSCKYQEVILITIFLDLYFWKYIPGLTFKQMIKKQTNNQCKQQPNCCKAVPITSENIPSWFGARHLPQHCDYHSLPHNEPAPVHSK